MHIKLQKLDAQSHLRNIYPSEVVAKFLADNPGMTLYGTFRDHIDITQLSISVSKIVCAVSDLRIEDGYLTGTCEVLNTPYGIIFKDLLAADNQFMYSAYGAGHITTSLDSDGNNVRIIDDFFPTGVSIVNVTE